MGRRNSRRQFLAAVGVAATSALAGCSDDDDPRDGPGSDGMRGDHHGDGPRGTDSTDGGRHHHGDRHNGDGRVGPVPETYETATALDGTVRDPGSLSSKRAVNYQSEPAENDRCAGCRYYIPDKDGDGLGACAVVAGRIEPDGWCASYVSLE